MNRRTLLKGLSAAGLALAGLPVASARRTPTLAPIPLSELSVVGEGINTPETVVCSRDGRIYATDRDAAVAALAADGTITHIGKMIAPLGLALDRQGRMVVANFGLSTKVAGPLQRLDLVTGAVETLVDRIAGRPLLACNDVAIAANGAIYCTHTSWGPPVDETINPTVADGFVFRVDPDHGVTVARDGLRAPNGCCLDADERHLYIAETSAGRIMRLERQPDGLLGPPRPYGPPLGLVPANATVEDILHRPAAERSQMGHPDGIAFDADGNLWVTLVFANKVMAITPKQELIEIIHDPEGKIIAAPSSIAWGGPDLTDLYVGMIGKPHLAKAKSPVPGLALADRR